MYFNAGAYWRVTTAQRYSFFCLLWFASSTFPSAAPFFLARGRGCRAIKFRDSNALPCWCNTNAKCGVLILHGLLWSWSWNKTKVDFRPLGTLVSHAFSIAYNYNVYTRYIVMDIQLRQLPCRYQRLLPGWSFWNFTLTLNTTFEAVDREQKPFMMSWHFLEDDWILSTRYQHYTACHPIL